MNQNTEATGPSAPREMLRTFSSIASSGVGPIARGSVKTFAKTDKQVVQFADWLQSSRKIECKGYIQYPSQAQDYQQRAREHFGPSDIQTFGLDFLNAVTDLLDERIAGQNWKNIIDFAISWSKSHGADSKAAWELISQPNPLEKIFSTNDFTENGKIFLLHALNMMWMGMKHTLIVQNNPNHLDPTSTLQPASSEGQAIAGMDHGDAISSEQVERRSSESSGEVKTQDSADHKAFNVDSMVESGSRSRLTGVESAAHTPFRVVSPSDTAATGVTNPLASVQETQSARMRPVQPAPTLVPFFSPSTQPTVLARRGVHAPPALQFPKRPTFDKSIDQAPQTGPMPLGSTTAGVGFAGSVQTGTMPPPHRLQGPPASPSYRNLQQAVVAAPVGPASILNYNQPATPQYLPPGVQMIENPYAYQMHPDVSPHAQSFHEPSFRGRGARRGSMRSVYQGPKSGYLPPHEESMGRFVDGSHGQPGGRSYGHGSRHSQDMSSVHGYRGNSGREAPHRGGMNDRRRSEVRRGSLYYANQPPTQTVIPGARNVPYVHTTTVMPNSRASEPFPVFNPVMNLDENEGCGPDFIGKNRSDVDTIWVHGLVPQNVKLLPDQFKDMAGTVSQYFTETFQVTPRAVSVRDDKNSQPVGLVSLASAEDARKVLRIWKTFRPDQQYFFGNWMTLKVALKHYAPPGYDRMSPESSRSTPRLRQIVPGPSDAHRPPYRNNSDAYERQRTMSHSKAVQVEVLRRPSVPHDERQSSSNDKTAPDNPVGYSPQDARSSFAPQSSGESESPSPIKGKKRDKPATQTRKPEGNQSGHGDLGNKDNASEAKKSDAKLSSRSSSNTSPAAGESTTSSNRSRRSNQRRQPKAERVGSSAGMTSQSSDFTNDSGVSKGAAKPGPEPKTGGESKSAKKGKKEAHKKFEKREPVSKTAPVASSSEPSKMAPVASSSSEPSKTPPVASSSETKDLRHSSSRYFTPNELPPESASDDVVAPTVVSDKPQDKHTEVADQTNTATLVKESSGKPVGDDQKDSPILSSSAKSAEEGIGSETAKGGDSGSNKSDDGTVVAGSGGEKLLSLNTMDASTPRTSSSGIKPQPIDRHADTPEGQQSFVTTRESPDSPTAEDYVDAEPPKEEVGQANPLQAGSVNTPSKQSSTAPAELTSAMKAGDVSTQPVTQFKENAQPNKTPTKAGKQDSGSLHPMAAAKAQKKAEQAALKKKKRQDKKNRTKSGQYPSFGSVGPTSSKMTSKSDSSALAAPQLELSDSIEFTDQGRKGKGRADTKSETGSARTPSLASSSGRTPTVDDINESEAELSRTPDIKESKHKGKGRNESKSEAGSAKAPSVASSSAHNHDLDDGKVSGTKVELERQTTEDPVTLKSDRNDSVAQPSKNADSPAIFSPRSTDTDSRANQGSGASTPKQKSPAKESGNTRTKAQTNALIAVPDLSRLRSQSPKTRISAGETSKQSKVQDTVSDTSSRTLGAEKKSDEGGQVGLGIELATMDQANLATATLSPDLSKRSPNMSPTKTTFTNQSPVLTPGEEIDVSKLEQAMNIPKPPTPDDEVDDATADLSKVELSDAAAAPGEVASGEKKKKKRKKNKKKKTKNNKNNSTNNDEDEDEGDSQDPDEFAPYTRGVPSPYWRDVRHPAYAREFFERKLATLNESEEDQIEWKKFHLRHYLRVASADGSAALQHLYKETIAPGLKPNADDQEVETSWKLLKEDLLPGGDFDVVSRLRILLRAEDPEAVGDKSAPFSTMTEFKDIMYRGWGPLTEEQIEGLKSHLAEIYGEHYTNFEYWGLCLEQGPGSDHYNSMVELFEECLPWTAQNEFKKLKEKMEGRLPTEDSRYFLAKKEMFALKATYIKKTMETQELRAKLEAHRQLAKQRLGESSTQPPGYEQSVTQPPEYTHDT